MPKADDAKKCKYTYVCDDDGVHEAHSYQCVGNEFGLEFWVRVINGSMFGGLEMHYRTAPDYMDRKHPSHEHCHVIDGPCWHDGTSLYAHDVIIPIWLQAPHDHRSMFRWLKDEYERRRSLLSNDE